MKMKKWLKCLLMTMALMMVVNVGAISTTIPAAAKASAKTIKVGTKFQSGKFQYKVTSLSGDTGTATLIGTKSKKLTSVNVPETVKKGKYTLTVDAIGDNAFKNCKKLKSVATNTKIKKIGKNAFKGCKKLTAVNIKSAELKSVGKNALKGISKQAVVTAPAGTANSYEDMLGVDVEAPAAAAQVFAARSVSAPKPVVQTEKAPQTEAPKATETEAPATEAPKATESETQKAIETEASVEIEAPATETPKATETEAPATEAPKATGTEAPAAEAPKPATKRAQAPHKAAETETEEPKTESEAETLTPEKICAKEGHLYTEWEETVQPTCASSGTKRRVCSRCGRAVQTTSFGAPTGRHTYDHVEVAADCEKSGYSYDICTVCGKKSNSVTIPAKGHSWVEYKEEASCTKSGLFYTYCSVCKKLNGSTNYTSPKGHRWDHKEEVVEPTCSEFGRLYDVCGVCGAYGSYTLLDKKAHSLEESEDHEATCTQDGYIVMKCKNCDYTEKKATGKAKGHVRTCKVIEEATCQHEGKAEWTCTVCGDVLERVLPKTDHRWTLNSDRNGLDKCAYCGISYPGTSETEASAKTEAAPKRQSAPRRQNAPAQTMPGIEDGPYIEEPTPETETETEHVCEFDWVVTKKPYCGYLKNDMTWRDTGSRTGTCKVCGKTVKEGLRAEHQLVVTKDMEPTCTTRGATYSKCTICGYESISFKDKDGNIRKALGHDMVHHEDPATCTEDGRSYDECSRCGLIENEQVTATKLGHDFTPETEAAEGARFYSAVKDSKEAYIVREPSCTLVGVKVIPCQHDNCGEVKTQYIPSTGHDLRTEDIAATCSSNEKIVTTCTKCDYTSTQVKDGTKLPHKLEAEEMEPSTTTARGYVRMVCKNPGCNYAEKDLLSVAKQEHTWEHVTGGEKDKEGVLASLSHEHRIRTERCSCCEVNLRYAYHLSTTKCDEGDGDYYTNCKDNSHWVGWEEVPCSTKGHTWKETEDGGHAYCTLCGSIKPESGEGSASRIVWSICIKTEADGVTVDYAQPTAISSDHCIDYAAPEKDGYVFDCWTWDRDDDISKAGVFAEADNADRSKLHVSCDYMNVTFIAHYKSADSAVTVSEPAGTTQTIHGTMEIDLSLGDGSPATTHEHEVEEQHEALHEGENMTEMPSAPAEAVTKSPALEEAVTE